MSQPSDDRELASQARAGSADALATLYCRYASRLMAVAYRLTGSVADAEDVVHDVFLGLPEALRRYEDRGRLGPWLSQLAARSALTRMRQTARSREVQLGDEHEIAGGVAIPAEEEIALAGAIQALPHALRVVFVLKVIEGYSHAEIGSMLGISPGASELRLVRSMKQLRGVLGDGENER